MKVLIISKNAFPAQDPRSFRASELSEQLAKMGHNVTHYSVHGHYDYTQYENECGVKMRNIKTKFATEANDGSMRYNIFDKLMYHAFRRVLFWPLCEFHFAVEKIIQANPNMDLLITIAFPHSIHSGAAKAKLKHPDIFPKKWICDCGDPFMLNPFLRMPHYMKKYEILWCSLCDHITVPTQDSIKGYYKDFWKKISVIPQGFNFESTPIATYCKNKVPTFIFVGTVYPGIRDPHSFMDFLLTFNKPYKFIMMMKSPLEEKYVIESKGKIEYVLGKNRKEVVWKCSLSDFLINITNPSTVQTPSKLIDYGIANRPILNIPTCFDDPAAFYQFYNGDYSLQHKVSQLENYRIENVVQQFLGLTEKN